MHQEGTKKIWSLVIPLIATSLGMILGTIIMLVSGYNPIQGYAALVEGAFGGPYYLGETIRAMIPLILSGLSVAFAFRTGLFNIGVEGQLIIGWLAAVWVGVAIEIPTIIHLPLSILVAGIAGGIWGFIPGFLKAKFHVHEVIVTIMMNYIALYVTNHLISTYLKVPGGRSEEINPSASLASNFLQSMTDFSRLHYGLIVAILGAFVMWFLLWKTTKGFELRAVGLNQHAARYAGMGVEKSIIFSMVVAGAFAGVAGAMEGLGTYQYIPMRSAFTGIGFDGIAVALLGSNSAIGVVLASLLFSSLDVGSLNMQSAAGVPTELVEIVIALIIFLVASSYLIRWFLDRFKREGN